MDERGVGEPRNRYQGYYVCPPSSEKEKCGGRAPTPRASGCLCDWKGVDEHVLVYADWEVCAYTYVYVLDGTRTVYARVGLVELVWIRFVFAHKSCCKGHLHARSG